MKYSNKGIPSLLASGYFVQIHPEIVRKLKSANQALCLQKLSYWLEKSENEHDGYFWVYNTYETWSKDLGLSPSQVERAMLSLIDLGLVITCQPENFNRRKWYRIDFEHEFWDRDLEPPLPDLGQSDDAESGIALPDNASSTIYTKNNSIEYQNIPKESSLALTPVFSDEIILLGTLFADSLENLGCKRPIVSKAWLSEFDKLIRIDKRETWQIEKMIQWAHNDGFWAKNILSPLKLRKHYEAMRLSAQKKVVEPKGMPAIRAVFERIDAEENYGQEPSQFSLMIKDFVHGEKKNENNRKELR